MKEKYSLFLLEKYFAVHREELTQKTFEYVNTFETLEKAQEAQSKYNLKTIILPSY
jgi:hypothetical protein